MADVVMVVPRVEYGVGFIGRTELLVVRFDSACLRARGNSVRGSDGPTPQVHEFADMTH